MLWLKATGLTLILLVDSVWVLALELVAFVDSLAPVPAMKWLGLISYFNSGGTTDGAQCCAVDFVVVRKLVVHLPDKEQ